MSSIVSNSSALAAAIAAVSKSLEMESFQNTETQQQSQLPLQQQPQQQQIPPPPALLEAQSSTMESLFSKTSAEKKVLMNILVVDDAMSNRKMLTRYSFCLNSKEYMQHNIFE
jgi:hypothetical protein